MKIKQIKLDKSQFENLVFLQFPEGLDAESFGDYDQNEGMGGCNQIDYELDGKEGVIVHKRDVKSTIETIKQAAEFFLDEEGE